MSDAQRVSYPDDDDVRQSRDPTNYNDEEPRNPKPVDGGIVLLTAGTTGQSVTLLVDAREGEPGLWLDRLFMLT